MTDTTPAPELMPCPFCTEGKTVSTYFDHEQGDKWGYASCDACGSRGPEVRTNYDRDDNAPWRAKAIAAWNTRADLIPAALAVPEVRALVEAAEDYLDADPDTVKGNEALGRLHAALAALRARDCG